MRLPLQNLGRARWGERDPAPLPRPARSPIHVLVLTTKERWRAWSQPKEALQAEIKKLTQRIHAMQCAREEALTNALLFENTDITSWLRQIAATDKGALGIRVKELEAENKALQGPSGDLRASERKAWQTLDKVLEAWEIAAGLRGWGAWDSKTETWVVDQHEETLPAKVVESLKEWLVSQRPKPRIDG